MFPIKMQPTFVKSKGIVLYFQIQYMSNFTAAATNQNVAFVTTSQWQRNGVIAYIYTVVQNLKHAFISTSRYIYTYTL